MVHRDIKPANLIVTSARQVPAGDNVEGWPEAPLVKILDFGLARSGGARWRGIGAGRWSDARGVHGRYAGIHGPRTGPRWPLGGHPQRHLRPGLYSVHAAGRPAAFQGGQLARDGCHAYDPAARPDHPLQRNSSSGVVRPRASHVGQAPEDRFQTPAEVATVLRPWARRSAVSSLPPSVLGSSLSPAALANATAPLGASGPVSPSAQPAPVPPSFKEPPVPPDVMMMHFQARVRTILLAAVVAVVGIGCVLYLPDIGNTVLQLWQRLTPHPTKSAPPR